MAVREFPTDATRSEQADWLELQVVISGRSRTSGDLVRVAEVGSDPDHMLDLADEDEPSDPEILQPDKEKLVDDVFDELQWRADALGAEYPFALTVRNTGWALELRGAGDLPSQLPIGQFVYVACLLISTARDGVIDEARLSPSIALGFRNAIAQNFQALSYVVSHQILGGPAYWLGWPRPDKSAFEEALKDLTEKMGVGELKETPPAWTTGHEKDGTVDLVSWRSFVGEGYGTIVLYGQVASGQNWRGKSIKNEIAGLFFDWFVDKPSESWLPAMFIPFPLHHSLTVQRHIPFHQGRTDHARSNERNFGTVVDRLRMADLASGASFDEPEWLPFIIPTARWCDQLCGELQA